MAPGSCARFGNEYYENDEELIYACADAMREEYQAIIDAGLILQLDDPAIAENWDQIVPEPSVEDYQRFTMVRVEALNHAIRDLPPDRIRFHLCWGSWHGPHVTDIPMADIVDVMLQINAGRVLVRGRQRAPRARVEGLAATSSCPRASGSCPGVVSHSTNVVEHPRARRRPDRPLRRGRRARERDRLHRLRPRRTRPPADRVGEAPVARGGREARERAAVPVAHAFLRSLLTSAVSRKIE